MRRYGLAAGLFIALLITASCAKPDQITRINSPQKGLYYTVETYYGHGAIDSDFTRVYVHLERNGRAKRMLVLDGTSLTVARSNGTAHAKERSALTEASLIRFATK